MKTFINNGNNNSYDIVHIPGTTSQYDVTAVDGKLVYTSKDGARQYTVDAAEGFRFKEDGSFRYDGNWKYKWADLFAPFASQVPSQGLIASYNLDGNVNDILNGYNGTWTGTATYGTGILAQGVTIGGNLGDGIRTASIADRLSGESDITVSFWIKSGSTVTDTEQILICGVYSDNVSTKGQRFTVGTLNGKLTINRFWGVEFSDINASDIIDNRWHHVVAVAKHETDGVYYTIWIDGVERQTVKDADISALNIASDAWVNMGKGQVDGNYNLKNGSLDEVNIYNVALGDADIQRLFTAPSANSAMATCAAWKASGKNIDGVYTINPTGTEEFTAYCDMTTSGGGWTLVWKFSRDTATITGNNTLNWGDNANIAGNGVCNMLDLSRCNGNLIGSQFDGYKETLSFNMATMEYTVNQSTYDGYNLSNSISWDLRDTYYGNVFRWKGANHRYTKGAGDYYYIGTIPGISISGGGNQDANHWRATFVR